MTRDATTLYVAVAGPGDATEEEERLAHAVGRGLAVGGAVLLSGGLGGVMEASARGAVEAGGVTVGLLPGAERSSGNSALTVAIPTGLGELRNGLLVRAADVVVAIGGAGRSHGTLSEIALALRTGKPVLGLMTWKVGGVVEVESPEEAAAAALALRG